MTPVPGAVVAWVVQALVAGTVTGVVNSAERLATERTRRRLLRMAVMQVMAGSLEVWWTMEQLMLALREQGAEVNLLELQDTMRRLLRLDRVRVEGARWAITTTGLTYVGALRDVGPTERWVVDDE